jgi:hypothetical protein
MARDKDTGIVKKTPVIVDEQTKAAGMRAAAASAPAAKKAIAKTSDELMIDRINAQIAKTQTSVSNLENIAAEVGSINPAALKKFKGESNTTFNERVTAAYKAQEQPTLTDAQAAQGYTVQFVRTGAGGKGEYRIIKPLGLGSGDAIGTLDNTNNSNNNNSNNGNNNNSGNNNTSSNATLVSTETDAYGNTIGIFSDGTTKVLLASGNKYKSTVDEDAYGILEKTFKDFGLEDLVPEIKKYMEAGLGSEQAGLELRKTTAYLTRFKGNEVRRAAGLNVLSEDAYLGLENSYNETLRRFGLQGYFGTDRKVATATMASIIGNDISAVEFRDRIDTVVTRVNNADANIKTTLRAFYNITDSDLVKYFLNPKENLPKLQEKVTAAEIGSEFIKQGLVTGVLSAEEFAKLGIDKQAAAKGAETIAAILPETRKLGSIYDEEAIDYTQKTAEEEVLKGLDSARRKRLRLAEKEVGSFSGSAGLARGALTNNRSSAF